MPAEMSMRRTWPTEVRLLARSAEHAGQAGRWLTADSDERRRPVTEDELTALVGRFDAYDIVCPSTLSEAAAYAGAGPAARAELRHRLERAADLALRSMQQRGNVPDGLIAQFFHE